MRIERPSPPLAVRMMITSTHRIIQFKSRAPLWRGANAEIRGPLEHEPKHNSQHQTATPDSSKQKLERDCGTAGNGLRLMKTSTHRIIQSLLRESSWRETDAELRGPLDARLSLVFTSHSRLSRNRLPCWD